MSVELQQIKRSSNLTEWAEMVRCCRSSGMTVRAWCQEQGLNEKTYYHRQKQVCNALPERFGQPVQFAEVSQPALSTRPDGGVRIRIGAAEISVGNGADLALLREVVLIVARTC